MRPRIDCPYRLFLEVCRGPEVTDVPVHHLEVTGDLAPLVEETHTRAVLAGALPHGLDSPVEGRVEVIWSREPFVRQIEVELSTTAKDGPARYRVAFTDGRWSRRALGITEALVAEGQLAAGQLAYTRLVAERAEPPPELRLAPLEELPLGSRTLADAGVRELGKGTLVPDRPILVNETLEEELIELCERAGPRETGGAVLGQVVRLDRPLRGGTLSPIVTVLTSLVLDERHVGGLSTLAFSPEGLADAHRIADLRDLGERVLTVAHTHGWGCGECNQSVECALPQCTYVSGQDYRVLEALLPSKATLMPIAGRELGAPGRRPVLAIHGWRGGVVEPLSWRRYCE